MNNLGFRYAMLACAGMMLMNILSALVFEEKSMHADNDDESKLKSSQQDGKQKFTLKIKGSQNNFFLLHAGLLVVMNIRFSSLVP